MYVSNAHYLDDIKTAQQYARQDLVWLFGLVGIDFPYMPGRGSGSWWRGGFRPIGGRLVSHDSGDNLCINTYVYSMSTV